MIYPGKLFQRNTLARRAEEQVQGLQYLPEVGRSQPEAELGLWCQQGSVLSYQVLPGIEKQYKDNH